MSSSIEVLHMKLQNKAIHGPQGALLTLQQVDLERLRESHLQAEVVLYLAKEDIDYSGFTARYKGVITPRFSDPHSILRISDLALPQPTYSKHFGSDDFQKKIEHERLLPGSALFEHPSFLEFVVSAKTPEEYRGLSAFRDVLVPELFKAGYTRKNPQHTSTFWLYAGKDTPKGEDYVLYVSSIDGLTIAKTEHNGVKIFTEHDVRRFLALRME